MGSPRGVLSNSAVGVVAVSAFNQAFHHLVVRGIRELRLDVCMALEAEVDLGHL
jgi:hypothetical protein